MLAELLRQAIKQLMNWHYEQLKKPTTLGPHHATRIWLIAIREEVPINESGLDFSVKDLKAAEVEAIIRLLEYCFDDLRLTANQNSAEVIRDVIESGIVPADKLPFEWGAFAELERRAVCVRDASKALRELRRSGKPDHIKEIKALIAGGVQPSDLRVTEEELELLEALAFCFRQGHLADQLACNRRALR